MSAISAANQGASIYCKEYRGGWAEDLMDGEGVAHYSNGDYYQGSFQQGLKHGYGIYKYANGDQFEGEWYKDLKSMGVMRERDTVYSGSFLNNQREGKGLMKFLDSNESYEGQWQDNQMHGKGIYRYADGSVFEGEWRENAVWGEGQFTDANKVRSRGDFFGTKFRPEAPQRSFIDRLKC